MVSTITSGKRLLDNQEREVRVLDVGFSFVRIKTKVGETKAGRGIWRRRVAPRAEVELTMQEAD